MFCVLILSSTLFSFFFFGGSLIDCLDEAFDVAFRDESVLNVSVSSSILYDDFDTVDDSFGPFDSLSLVPSRLGSSLPVVPAASSIFLSGNDY